VTRHDAIVIGAGVAGLSAAVRLAREGLRVLVVEARSRLGGRATSFRDRETGERVDNGQHILLGCYRDTLAFLRDIGAEGHVAFQRQLAVTMIDRDGRMSRLDCSGLPAPLHLVAGVFDWSALSWADRLGILRMGGPIRTARQQIAGGTGRIAASPGETVTQWLVRNGQTDRAREMLWNPLALAALNQQPDAAAAPTFARVLGEMFTADTRDAAIVLPTRPLDELYAEPARRFIEARGGAVVTGLAQVVVKGGRVDHVACGAGAWATDHVIAAVPWFALPGLFQGDMSPLETLLHAAAATSASPILTVHIWFDRPVLDQPFIGLPGRAMQWVFDQQVVVTGTDDGPSHLTFVSSGAAALLPLQNDALIGLAQRELASALPSIDDARLVNATVVREPRATFSLAPGQPVRPATTTEVKGLLLAGDWVDTGLPATIESAARSGHLAADAALQATLKSP
jgi:squalene-associated FAD-dependent desaturase